MSKSLPIILTILMSLVTLVSLFFQQWQCFGIALFLAVMCSLPVLFYVEPAGNFIEENGGKGYTSSLNAAQHSTAILPPATSDDSFEMFAPAPFPESPESYH